MGTQSCVLKIRTTCSSAHRSCDCSFNFLHRIFPDLRCIAYGATLLKMTLQDLLREGILKIALNRTPDRPRPERGIETLLDQEFLGSIAELEADARLSKP